MGKKRWKSLLTVAMMVVLALACAPGVVAAQTEIGNSETKEGADSYTLTVGQEYTTTLNGVEGYVSFVTPAQEGYVLVAFENISMSGTHKVRIVDAAEKEIGQYDASIGAQRSLEFKSEEGYRNSAKMAPNTRYYIQIGQTVFQPNGAASVSVTFLADDCPNGQSNARLISTNTQCTGKLDAAKSTDKDWYTFTATKTGTHRIFLKNISMLKQINCQLYDSYGNSMKKASGASASDTAYDWGEGEADMDVRLEAGKSYYLEIYGDKGEYSFNVNCQTIETITLEPTVTLDGMSDYQLQYTIAPDTAFNKTLEFESDNTSVASVNDEGKIRAIGTGKAIITAKAKDGGGATAQCVVYVNPDQPYSPKGSSSTVNSIKLKWSSVEKATGYYVYQKKNGKWVKIGSTTKKSYTVKKLKSTTGYQFKIQAYMKLDGKTFVSPKSETGYYATKPKATSITSITKMAKKKINGVTCYFAKVKWKKIAGVKEYMVYGKLASSGSMTYIGTYKGTSAEVVLQYYSGSKKCTFYVKPVFSYKGESFVGAKSKGKVYTFK